MLVTLTGWMLYTMWVVLGLMGIKFLLGLYRSVKASELPDGPVLGFLRDLLYYVFPLYMLAGMMSLDPTGWLLLIAYYVGGVGVIVHYLKDIKSKL
ncbi:hypothetical protein [Paenibacillus hexagrammi]|uniref:YggT family protein n=1 Tax=Paenibacillus hexagrammi TaxID=2908839 RepID=A0ABY3SP09_9BACL|nr:hypothetical protein [Paenibacillus sp. YPD9-1]UJF34941.1 hypothetical protein L0M14_07290 [Paenibacillus sp. YPD9-1]